MERRGGKNKLRLAGQRFCKLVAIRENGRTNRKNVLWYCECDCGNNITVRSAYLLSGRVGSCGCQNNRLRGPDNPRWSGYKGIGGSYWHKTKQNAKCRGLELSITIEFVWELFEKQGRKCALSGLPLEIPVSDKSRREDITRFNASLDRKDSSKGYTPENVQWIHKVINKMKMELPEDVFIEFCRRIADHSRGIECTYCPNSNIAALPTHQNGSQPILAI